MSSAEFRMISGRLVSIQDLGRLHAHVGLSTNGAVDQYAARAANALVGNDAHEPLLESLLDRFEIEVTKDVLLAVTGAEALVTIDGVEVDQWQPVRAHAGSTIGVSEFRGGNYVYLSIAGSWEVERFAGSVTSDAGMSFHNDLKIGQRVEIDRVPPVLVNPWLGVSVIRAPALQRRGDLALIDIMPGPDISGIPGIAEALTGAQFTVDPQSNYVGVRLRGELPAARPTHEILSHGVAIGAVELPPSNELIILQRGRSLTAGYPVVAVVSRRSQDLVAQLVPGAQCQMRWRDMELCLEDTRTQRLLLSRTTELVRSALVHLAA